MRQLLLFAFAGLLTAQVTSVEMLRHAVGTGDVKTVESLLAAGISANTPDRLGQTPITLAIFTGQPSMVDLLLEWHADPNAPMTGLSRHSQTPLQYAAEHGDLRVAASLIAAGARVNEAGDSGRTPLHFALLNHLDMAR